MKLINIKILFLLAILATVYSCAKDEIDKSEVTRFKDYGIEGLPASLEMQEGDSHTFEFTLNDDQITDISLEIVAGEGSSSSDADFSLSTSSLDISALEGKGTFDLAILNDYLTEGDEHYLMTVKSTDAHGLPLSQVVDITIKDVVTEDLVITFDWDGPFVFGGTDYHWCQFVDMDILVTDADGNDLGIYDAATGACPEVIIRDWEDGEYFLTSNLWDLGPLDGLGIEDAIPISVNVFKQDFFDETFTPQAEEHWTAIDTSGAKGNGELKPVFKLDVSGKTYTITSTAGDVIVSGLKGKNSSDSE